jgi:hypothetical protein
LLIIIFIASFAISGIIESVVAAEAADSVSLVHVFVIAVICFAWCKADVAERNIPAPPGSAILCGVLPVVGVPAHFFRTRQFRSALIAILQAIGVFVVSVLVYGLMLYIGDYLLG